MTYRYDESQITYLLAFHRAMKLTHVRLKKISEYFEGDIKKAWESDGPELKQAGLDTKGLSKLEKYHAKVIPEQEFETLQKKQITILVRGGDDYPIALEHIHNPPALLFMKGSLSAQDFPSIGVVGSRKITTYGKKAIEHLIEPIAAQGVTITSGLAFGTDFLAHKAAIKHNARTIAVLGSSIDHIYPAAHKIWVDTHLASGKLVLLSEWLPQTPLIPEHFPVRNRIIAGLSRCLIVVEGTKKSGSLITAQLANEQSKDIFAVPGDIFSAQSQGPNQLISDGMAHPLTNAQEVLQYLGINHKRKHKKDIKSLPSFGIESDILKCFEGSKTKHIDEIKRISGIAQHKLSSTLILLEMQGFIKNIGQQKYVKSF